MSIEKNTSIVLSVTPYRESSILASLYSQESGRINVIAKGTRRNDRRSIPLERGMLVEHTTYRKPHRDLHQITDCAIKDFFPGIRYDLEKTALRDLLFDICLKAINAAEGNLQLFTILLNALLYFDHGTHHGSILLIATARTLLRIAEQLGFSPDLSCCSTCHSSVNTQDPFYFVIQDGSLLCRQCTRPDQSRRIAVSGSIISLLTQSREHVQSETSSIPVSQGFFILRLLVDYCKYHFDIDRQLPSFGFLYQLYQMQEPETQTTQPAAANSSSVQPYPSKETQCQTLP